MGDSISRLLFLQQSHPSSLPQERPALSNVYSQVPLLPTSGPTVLTETRTVSCGSGGLDVSFSCDSGSAERMLDLETKLTSVTNELRCLKKKPRRTLDDWAEDFAKKRQLEGTLAREADRIRTGLRTHFQDLGDLNSKLRGEYASLREGAHKRALYESALSSEREETARLRATLSGLRGVQACLQAEQEQTKKLRIELEKFQSRLRDQEELQRRGMSDRVKIPRLEGELHDAKTVTALPTAERQLRIREQFQTPDHSPKSAAPNRRLAKAARSHTSSLSIAPAPAKEGPNVAGGISHHATREIPLMTEEKKKTSSTFFFNKMNEYYYTYSKLRQEFGRPVSFTVTDARTLGIIEPNPEHMEQLLPQNPRNFCGDTLIELSEHTVNTGSVSVSGKGMRHVEGGWPKEVDPLDAQEVAKWKKRAERDPAFLQNVKQLTADCSLVLQQNLVVDLYQNYFAEEQIPRGSERLSVKSVALLKDHVGECKRAVTCVAWHPDGPQKLVVGYGILKFQGHSESLPTSALLWDPGKPNEPLAHLGAPSPAVSLAFNAKISDLLIGGCYSGVVCLWDLRKGLKPLEISCSSSSHFDPVYEVAWAQSKTSTEFVSASTDGRILWWDCRSLKEPVEECRLTQQLECNATPALHALQSQILPHEQSDSQLLGAVSLAWSLEAGPTKYLIGTEQGIILGLKTRPKKPPEISQRFGCEGGRHYGPVCAVRRHPFHSKFFLSVGDWTAKVWMEEVRTPLVTTPHHPATLTDGQWSPTRPGLLMLTGSDGFLSFWDYYYKQNEVALQHKVGNAALTCVSVQSHGELAAIGDVEGRVTVVGLCEGLCTSAPNEKAAIGAMLEREARREKNIEVTRRQSEGKRLDERQPNHVRNNGPNKAVESARDAFFSATQQPDDHTRARRSDV
ncbi:hypothetical protein Efla_000529 [Eimeria flavescens]